MIRPFSRAPRWRLPLALAAILCVFVLAGCGTGGASDPLVAARVNGQGISLSDYQAMLGWDEASAALPSSSGQAPVSAVWQSPDGRIGLAQTQQTALDFLINLQLMRQQLHTLHLSVSAAALATAHTQLLAAIKGAFSGSDPSLKAALARLTPQVQNLLSEQEADQQTLLAHLQVPTVHVRVIVVDTTQHAQSLEDQLVRGADFAQLAKQDSLNTQTAQAGGEYGTVYIGQFGPQFDAQVFAKTPGEYVIIPISGGAALFEITKPANVSLSALNNATNEQTSFNAWLSMKVRPHASIQTDVAVG
ncbi:MAG: peptidylprolyl isomerase [Ktedonobacterales bacterium]